MTPAEQIRAARGDLSRAEASRRTGIPLRTLEHWEAGDRVPPSYALPGILQQLRRAQRAAPRTERTRHYVRDER